MVESLEPLVVELRLVTLDGRQLRVDRGGDIDDESGRVMMDLGRNRDRAVDQVVHTVRGGIVEAVVPFGKLRVEAGSFRDELALVVVGRAARGSPGWALPWPRTWLPPS